MGVGDGSGCLGFPGSVVRCSFRFGSRVERAVRAFCVTPTDVSISVNLLTVLLIEALSLLTRSVKPVLDDVMPLRDETTIMSRIRSRIGDPVDGDVELVEVTSWVATIPIPTVVLSPVTILLCRALASVPETDRSEENRDVPLVLSADAVVASSITEDAPLVERLLTRLAICVARVLVVMDDAFVTGGSVEFCPAKI